MKTIFLACALLASCFSSSIAGQLYVGVSGSDTGPGTYKQPWKTFDKAMRSVQAGDTLFILSGEYSETLDVSVGGDTTNGKIFITAYYKSKVVLAGNAHQGTAVSIHAPHIRLERVEIRNWSTAIDIYGSVSNIDIRNCKIHDIAYGITLRSGLSNISIDSCEMYAFGWYGFDATSSVGNPIKDVRVSNCSAHDADYSLPDHNPDRNSDGFALGHGEERNISFTNCIAYNVGDGFDLDGSNVVALNCTAMNTHYGAGGGFKCWGDSLFLINCLSYGNMNTGFELDQHTPDLPFGQRQTDTYIYNCTSVNNGVSMQVYDTLKHLILFNTLLAGGPKGTVDTQTVRGLVFERLNSMGRPNYTANNNVFHSINQWRYIVTPSVDYGVDTTQSMSLAKWIEGTGEDAVSKFVSTIAGVFVDEKANNYHLMAGSPCVDAGTTAYFYRTDKDGYERDAFPDVGCYEYSPLRSIPLESPQVAIVAYPNPANQIISLEAEDDILNGIVEILSLDGKSLTKLTIGNINAHQHYSIPVNNLHRGVYLLRIVGDIQSSTQLIILN